MGAKRVLAPLVATAALSVTACGTSTTGEEEKAQAAVETFLESCARENPLAAQDVLTDLARQRFVTAGSTVDACREILAFRLPAPAPDALARDAFRSADVQDVSTNGGFATALIVTESGERAKVELENSGDVWLLSNPERPPPPPEPPVRR